MFSVKDSVSVTVDLEAVSAPRGACTSREMPLHTDNAPRFVDGGPRWVILAAIDDSSHGPVTRLVDGQKIATSLEHTHPAVVRTLSRSVLFDRSAERMTPSAGPVLTKGRSWKWRYNTTYIRRGYTAANLPFPAELATALDTVERLAASDEHASDIRLGVGDVLVLDNYRMLHGRSAFEPGAPRHLLRWWIDP